MTDRGVTRAESIEAGVIAQAERIYPEAVMKVLKKHDKTLDRIEKLVESGADGRARALARSSGLLVDLSRAIAQAGREAAEAVKRGVAEIREAERHEDD